MFFNPLGAVGGAERSLLAWMDATRRAFPQAWLGLIVPAEGPLARAAADLGVDVEVLPMPARIMALGDSALRGHGRLTAAAGLARGGLLGLPGGLAYLSRLRKLLRALRPDLVHSNGIKTHLLTSAAILGARRKPKVVWHVHDFLSARPVVARGLRWAATGVAAAVAVSEAVARDARMAIPGLPVNVIYNVIDIEHFRQAQAAGSLLDELAGLPRLTTDPLRVVLVATYARWKGQDAFLEAAARMPINGREVRFYIVGGPIYRTLGSQFSGAELQELATRLGFESRVGFIDFRPDPADTYQAADIAVHASTQPEPFGMTVVEAMACGKPVIVSQAGGAAELFTDGVDGIGVPTGNVHRLADAMARLIADATLRERLGRNARASVVQRFDCRALAPRVRALYSQILSAAR